MRRSKMVQKTVEKTTKAQSGKYLTFKLGDENYGLEIHKVIEIIGMQDVTPVPRTPDHLRGVINLRGIIHPVIDLNKKFDMGMTEQTELTCIIVVTVEREEEKEQMGIIVDAVSEVEDIKEEEIEDTPSLGTDINTDFIIGMAKTKDTVKMLLDLQKILSDQDFNVISKVKDKKESD
ncbi:MAG: chemotaxis protein CheW [Candidatus Marinimicrobia bacterium]|nr:chemotaxis protein CheW [Candidatus Neomarinimicrobiota bacterium]